MRIEPGSMADYAALSAFHYRGERPGAVTSVVRMVVERQSVVKRFRRGSLQSYIFKQNSNNGAGRGGSASRPAEAGRATAGAAVDGEVEVVGVLVRSLPHLSCRLRDVATGNRYNGLGRREAAVMLNREVRCISRVVIEPRWRGMGLAVGLVRWALENPEEVDHGAGDPGLPRGGAMDLWPGAQGRSSDPACDGRSSDAASRTIVYTEALAAMGRVSPFFERAGMVKFERPLRWRAEHARLADVLERAGIDRAMLSRAQEALEHVRRRGEVERAWLERELRRWHKAAHRLPRARVQAMPIVELLRAASRELVEPPVYYVFRHG